jgi:hypothetical protein
MAPPSSKITPRTLAINRPGKHNPRRRIVVPSPRRT